MYIIVDHVLNFRGE